MRGGDRAVGEGARGEEEGEYHAAGAARAGGQGDRGELRGAEPQAERRGRVWALERDRVEQRLRRRDAVDGRLERLLAPEQGLRIPQREEARAEPRPGADQDLAPPRRRHRARADRVAGRDEGAADERADGADPAGEGISARAERLDGAPAEMAPNGAALEEPAGEGRADGRQRRRRQAGGHVGARRRELVDEDGARDRKPEKRRQRAGRAGERGLALVEPVAPRERRAADSAGGDHGCLGPDAEARRGRQQRRREQRADGARAGPGRRAARRRDVVPHAEEAAARRDGDAAHGDAAGRRDGRHEPALRGQAAPDHAQRRPERRGVRGTEARRRRADRERRQRRPGRVDGRGRRCRRSVLGSSTAAPGGPQQRFRRLQASSRRVGGGSGRGDQ